MVRRSVALLGPLLAAGLASGSPASAASIPLFCSVSQGTGTAGSCGTKQPQPQYSVQFTITTQVSVTGWDLPAGYGASHGNIYGCQAGQTMCWLTVRPVGADPVEVTVTVHYTLINLGLPAPAGLFHSSATATVPGTCPHQC